jgi:hypothetical protein
MKNLIILLVTSLILHTELFGIERTKILRLNLPNDFDIKDDSAYTKLLGTRKDGVFLVEIGTKLQQYRVVFDLNGNTDGFEPKHRTNNWVNSLGSNFYPWVTNLYKTTNQNIVSSFIKRTQRQEEIWTRNKILEFKTYTTNGFLSNLEFKIKYKEEHYELIGDTLKLITNSTFFGIPQTTIHKYGKIKYPISITTTGTPVREGLEGLDFFLGEIFSNDEVILEPDSRFVLGYRYIDNSLIISSENKFTGYKNNYTNEIYLFLIQDELLKDIRYPTQSTANISSLNNQLNIIVNNPEQAFLNIQSSTNLIDWNTLKTIQNEPSLEIVVPANKPKEFIRAIE